MGQERQELLVANEEHHVYEEEGYFETSHQYHNTHDHEHEKKHGIICRILTRLHLKKRDCDHQKLLSESQEHLSVPIDQELHPNKVKKQKKSKNETKKRFGSQKESKNAPFTQIRSEKAENSSANGNNSNNNMFSTNYEMLTNDLSCSHERICETDFEDANKPQQSREYYDVHLTVIQNAHEYSDDHFGECSLRRPEDDDDNDILVEKPRTESLSTGQYLKHKWHGKRVKKARKRFRSAVRVTWLSLQSGTNASQLIPSANTVATAFSPSNKR
ncbi:uncharacterized protein LOC120326985 [Styela clava]